ELDPDGTVIQKMSPKGRHSALQYGMCRQINAFAAPTRLAFAFPELRTVFGRAAYVPDVAVYRWARIPWTPEGEMPDDFNEPPDIAMEIVSPGQSVNSLMRRSLWYVENGVGVALVIDPEDRSVISFVAGQMPKALTGGDSIDM